MVGVAFPSPGQSWGSPFLLGVELRLALTPLLGLERFLRWGCPFPLGLGLAFPSWSEGWPFLLAVWSLPVFLVVVVASSFWLWASPTLCGVGGWPFLGVAPFVLWSGVVDPSLSGLGMALPSRGVVVGHSKKKKETYGKRKRK